MSTYFFSIDWFLPCCMQVTVLSLFALLLLRMLLRKPVVASTVAYSTVIAVVVLSLLAPSPAQHWIADLDFADFNEPQRLAGIQEPCPVSDNIASSPDQGAILTLEFASIRKRLNSLSNRLLSFSQPNSIRRPIGWFVVLLVFVGATRLASSVLHVKRVRQNCKFVNSHRINRILDELKETPLRVSNCRIAEVPQLSSAAVIGWWKPLLLLPANWRNWEEHELRSVLAHELAHIARHDFAWRLLSSTVATIHFYNPFVHLLIRRVALIQELEADIVASNAVGNRDYVRALSSLALKRDGHQATVSPFGLSPVFSGFLIRRIKVLSKNYQLQKLHGSTWARTCGAATVVAMSVASFVATAFCQSPDKQAIKSEEDSQPVARVARASSDRRETKSADPTQGMFGRKRLDLSLYPENDRGLVTFNLSDLQARPELKAARLLINRLAAAELKKQFESTKQPKIDIGLIKRITGTAQISTRYSPNNKRPNQNQLMLGIGKAEVEFSAPVHVKDWIQAFVPNAKSEMAQGIEVHTLPVIASLGPYPIKIAQSDPHKLFFNDVLARIRKENRGGDVAGYAQHTPTLNTSAWAKTFERVDGGLITIAATNKDIQTRKEFHSKDPQESDSWRAAKAFHHIEHTFRTLGVGLDASEDGRRLGIKIRFGCDDSKSANSVKNAVGQLCELGQKRVNSPTSANDQETQVLKQFLDGMLIKIEENGDGTSDVSIKSQLTDPFSLKDVVQLLVADLEG